jgi:hypothetical protein
VYAFSSWVEVTGLIVSIRVTTYECRVSGGRKNTIAKLVSTFVARGNSSGVRKKLSLVVSRALHARSCRAGGGQAPREHS